MIGLEGMRFECEIMGRDLCIDEADWPGIADKCCSSQKTFVYLVH